MRTKRLTAVFAMLLVGLLAMGCSEQRANQPNIEEQLNNQFDQSAELQDVNVSVDHDQRIVRLEGNVRSNDMKGQAEQMARSTASGYTISNEIAVEPEQEMGEQPGGGMMDEGGQQKPPAQKPQEQPQE